MGITTHRFKSLKLISTLLCLLASFPLTSAAGKTVELQLMQSPASIKGLQWEQSADSEYYSGFYATDPITVTIRFPVKGEITLDSIHSGFEHWENWIRQVRLQQNLSRAQGIQKIQSLKEQFHAEFDSRTEKKWQAFLASADPKLTFSGSLDIADWVKLSLRLKQQRTGDFSLYYDVSLSTEGTEPEALLANAREYKYAGGGNTAHRPLAFSPDSQHLAMGFQIIDLSNGEIIAEFASKKQPDSLVYSPNGDYLAATISNSKTLLIDAHSYELIAELSDERIPLRRHKVIGFSPDSTKLYTFDDQAYEWSVGQHTLLRSFGHTEKTASAAALSPNGQWLAIGQKSSNQASLWDIDKGTSIKTLTPPRSTNPAQKATWVDNLEFTADSMRLLATGFMGSAYTMWHLESGEGTLLPNSNSTHRSSLSPDGTLAAFGTWHTNRPNALAIINTKTGTTESLLRPLSDIWLQTKWSPDGQWIAIVSNYGRVLLFKYDD